jgi:TonB family protein
MRVFLIPTAAALVAISVAKGQDGPWYAIPSGSPPQRVAAIIVDSAYKGIAVTSDLKVSGRLIVLKALSAVDAVDKLAPDAVAQVRTILRARNGELKAQLATDEDRAKFDENVRNPTTSRAAEPANGDITYMERDVDQPARLVGNPPAPHYPDQLRSLKVEGEVLASFVVDTTGRADMSTFKVIRSSDRLFSDAVRDVLPSYRFLPAELRGAKVRQVVTQPFSFNLR